MKDLIKKILKEAEEYWVVGSNKVDPIKEGDFDWVGSKPYHGVRFKIINNMTAMDPTPLIWTIEEYDNEYDVVKVVSQYGGVNYVNKSDVEENFKSGKWYPLPIGKSINESNNFGGSEDEVTSLKGHKNYNGWVFVHRNLNRPPYWSIKAGKSGGPVIGYDKDIHLKDVIFKVQKGGQSRVRKEKTKNVHAGVVGKIIDSGSDYNTEGWTLVTYNPYRDNTFIEYESKEPIYSAKEVILKNEKEVWVKK